MSDIQKMEELLKSSDTKQIPKTGDLIKGIVVGIEKGEVFIDIDGIFTGVVRGKELVDESGQFSNLKIDDEVTATVVEPENEKGLLEMSFRSAGHQLAWSKLDELKDSGEVVDVKVLSANKGGLLVQLDRVQGFLPVSQLSSDNYPRVEGGNKSKILDKLRSFVGEKIKVKVIDTDEKEEKLIVSEKDVFAKEREALLSSIKVGDQVDGTVTAVVDFGVFVEFSLPKSDNKMEGLVHISELAWQRIDHPRDIMKTGEKIKAEVITIDRGRVSLSIKKLLVDPWKEATKKYKVDDMVEGKVLKTDKFGAFVELDNDIHGLAHISELSENQISHPDEAVKIGETYKFRIVSLEPDDHRLGLSLKEKKVKEEVKEETPKEEKVEVKKEKEDIKEGKKE